MGRLIVLPDIAPTGPTEISFEETVSCDNVFPSESISSLSPAATAVAHSPFSFKKLVALPLLLICGPFAIELSPLKVAIYPDVPEPVILSPVICETEIRTLEGRVVVSDPAVDQSIKEIGTFQLLDGVIV